MLIRRPISAIALAAALILAPITGGGPVSDAAPLASDPEPAPIVERKLDFEDFTLKALDGQPLNLRDYASGKRLIIVSYVAGWCPNSNNNGHVVKRLYDKFRDRGLGVVAVSEYSTPEEVSVHVNRIGADYPVVVETDSTKARKKSAHYRYRTLAGDSRKWGTPFYVLISAQDIEQARGGGVLARRVHTVSGEMIEAEAERFIEQHLGARAD
ncbi:MAG TPA: redoxin domain-containing protein [Blastocatellia bacterium]|nr:redoxin domain-containing protein [Blastocatellia bacterium]